MKPIVGVVPLYDLEKQCIWMLPAYLNMLRACGATPMILPFTTDRAETRHMFELCDGLLLTGGQDIDPKLYGEQPIEACGKPCHTRDALEDALLSMALSTEKPVLGICRGIQLMNVALGGTLWQDIPSQVQGAAGHETGASGATHHPVRVCVGTPLWELLEKNTIDVVSYHHQGIKKLAHCLQPMAYSSDGIVEAVCIPEQRFCWAVQWHPELSWEASPQQRAIVRAFVRASRDWTSSVQRPKMPGIGRDDEPELTRP